MSAIKLPSKFNTFEDVRRALQDVEKSINQLSSSVNFKAEGEVSDKDGKTGDTRITQNKDKSYTFEIKTKEGWKTPVIGESAIKFKGKPAERSKFEDKSIDEIEASDTAASSSVAKKVIYDEKADKFVLPRPDYDSGLLTLSNPITVTHNLGTHPILFQLLFTHDSGTTFHYVVTTSNNNTLIESTTTSTIIRKASSSWGWYYDSTQVDIDDGDGKFKLLLWK